MKQKETEESIKIKAVNYIELIPIIIKAMQEEEASLTRTEYHSIVFPLHGREDLKQEKI